MRRDAVVEEVEMLGRRCQSSRSACWPAAF